MASDLTEKSVMTNTASFFNDVRVILAEARKMSYSAVNAAMVEAYWQIVNALSKRNKRERSGLAMGPT